MRSRREPIYGLLDILSPSADRCRRRTASSKLDAWAQTIVAYGRQLAVDPHGVSDEIFGRLAERLEPDQIVALTAIRRLMVATNLFNNALRVDLDDYLLSYRKEGQR